MANQPTRAYPIGDGSLPVKYKSVLDPLETLTFAAAHTSQISLGNRRPQPSLVQSGFTSAAIDESRYLSGGRLWIGFDIGWSPDEYEAAGVTWQERGKRADESIKALKKIWSTDPVEFEGNYYRIPKSFIGPKPVQKPYPPIYMAAFTPPALKRVATEASGWFPVGIPLNGVGAMFDEIKNTARSAGRDPSALELIIAADVEIHKTPIDKDRIDFTGTLEQIAEDLTAARKLGAAEIVIYAQFSPDIETVQDIVARMDEVWRLAKQIDNG